MFNFFSRKPAQPALTKESPETQIVPETQETDSIARNQQLRTPSPSATSVISRGNNVNLSPLLGKQQTPSGPPITPSPPPDPLLDKPNRDAELGLISDPAALHALVSSIPPKILHEYTLKHLIPPARSTTNIHPPSSLTLTHLTSFFSSLTPPPKLHCVRCHKFFYEVENDDRSCLVPHDDDSAEVERVGSSKKVDTAYQTLWGCCGKMVEGDGDMGPPDGWCYEGKHTTDTKRARFRADSTIHNDKLHSCDKLKCFEPPVSSPESESDIGASPRPRKRKRTSRKRTTAAQSTAGEEQGGGTTAVVVGEGYEDDDEEEEDAMSVVSTRSKSSSRPKKKPKSLAATTSAAVAAGIPLPSSPGPSTPITAQATTTTSSSAPGSSSAAAPRPRKKRAKTTHDDKSFKPEATPVDDDNDEDHMMDVDSEGLTLTASSGKKRPGRPKGSKNKKSAVVVTTTTMMTGASVSVPTSPAAVGSGGGGGGGGGSKKKSVSPTREGGGGGGGNGSGGKKTHRPSVSFSATTKKDKDVVVGTSTSASASASSGSQRISGSMRPKKKTVKKLEEVVATSVEGEEGM
ncbi:hypothetical protein K435DRAFT_835942 [Dendrothele bispora CBS 962.96]|uniref:C2H2-type domain-containing protein n=1 Tax=Dendrothele bispora (strain CBS 962.96) TaxID=1314807 RepID=A0A4V4HHN3_DENBC|nr:hypothetical protein K435DRAFT_835942 [Dendrothele bispora CBS 962.96]